MPARSEKLAKFSIVSRGLYNEPAMKILAGAILWSALASAADMPYGVFRGSMAGFDGTKALGVLHARSAAGEIVTCGFDTKSYLELEKHRVTVDKLLEGDALEVVSYRRPKDGTCYILTLTVVLPPKPVRPTRRLDMSPPKQAKAPLVRRPSQTVAGVIVRVTDSSVTVRTREDEQTFQLRRETRFIGNGLRVERADLPVNQHVSVEAALGPDGVKEALQLTWGTLSVH